MSLVIYSSFRLVFGTLYPAYKSYKAVKTKNVKEYVSIVQKYNLKTIVKKNNNLSRLPKSVYIFIDIQVNCWFIFGQKYNLLCFIGDFLMFCRAGVLNI